MGISFIPKGKERIGERKIRLMEVYIMKYIDLHCDTVMKINEINGDQTLYSNDIASIDFKRMKKGKGMAQFFAIFLMNKDKLKDDYIGDDVYILNKARLVKKSVEANKAMISMAYNYDDIIRNDAEGKMSAILTIEDGRSVNGRLDKIKEYYGLGIRLISLTWNHENCFGFPNSSEPEIMNKGLTDFGKEAIRYMNEMGIIIDVSHLSDGGFYDVAKLSKLPFIASHSNARILSPHRRNMTDDMIKVLGEKGGVVGLNFGPEFLNEDISNKDSTIELMIKHLNHMRNIGGNDIIAFGSDFDGIRGNLEVDSCDKMPLIFQALKKAGWSEGLIEKAAFKNALRVIKDTMK